MRKAVVLFLLISQRQTQTYKPIHFSLLLLFSKVDVACRYLLMWRRKKNELRTKESRAFVEEDLLGDLRRDMMVRGDSFVFLSFPS